MEDLVSMCERRCRKACNLRSAAEDSDEACHSGSSGGRARRYRKRGSPKSAARDAGAMDTDPSPVRLWESEGHSEGYLSPRKLHPVLRAERAKKDRFATGQKNYFFGCFMNVILDVVK